jgi:hypothetical protein
MWKTQQKFEETVTVLNEQSPIRGSGGISVITDGTSKQIRMLMLPDLTIHRETRKEGQYSYERVYAHISKDEMDKVDMIPGKTRIVWNGLTYKVMNIVDYRSKILFQNAEIELRRQIGNI